MIQGVVTPEREATIRLVVSGPQGNEDLEAVIDTGFNDFLTLPPSIVTALGLPFAAPARATLADGSVVTMQYHHARVKWDGTPRSILVLAADGGPLVGMALLYGYDLFVETVDGGAVTITQRP